jgi:hypothetical protein
MPENAKKTKDVTHYEILFLGQRGWQSGWIWARDPHDPTHVYVRPNILVSRYELNKFIEFLKTARNGIQEGIQKAKLGDAAKEVQSTIITTICLQFRIDPKKYYGRSLGELADLLTAIPLNDSLWHENISRWKAGEVLPNLQKLEASLVKTIPRLESIAANQDPDNPKERKNFWWSDPLSGIHYGWLDQNEVP